MQKEEFLRKFMVHKNKMYRFARSYISDDEEAKDVVQDVLLKLWETAATLNEVKNTEAWCMALVRNKSLDRLKRAERKLRSVGDYSSAEANAVSAEPAPDRRLSNKELGEMIQNSAAALPEKQRAAFHLRDVEGYSYLEISETLEMDMNQVKVNIFRARKALREALTNRISDERRPA